MKSTKVNAWKMYPHRFQVVVLFFFFFKGMRRFTKHFASMASHDQKIIHGKSSFFFFFSNIFMGLRFFSLLFLDANHFLVEHLDVNKFSS